jgi:uncharacterized protein with FMN-binding domain
MKKFIIIGLLSFTLMSFMQDSSVMTKENDVTVVNTTLLCKNVKGYTDSTPLKIYFKNGKILRIKPLRNKETVQYFALIKKQMLPKWVGMTAKSAEKAKVDAVTGATVSSKAVMKNVQKGCEYYNKNN